MGDKCGARMWAYDHWACDQARHSVLKRHRFNNYTGARIPRVWRVKALWRVRKCNKRLLAQWKKYRQGNDGARLMFYNQVLYPCRYEPIDWRVRAATQEMLDHG